MRLAAIALALFAFACHDHEDYATFQACYDDHTTAENLPFQEAVVVCCLDHPLPASAGGDEPCGQTAPECITFLDANLTSTATSTEIEAACDEYVTQKGL